MTHVSNTVTSLQSNVAALHASQIRHAETQMHLHDQMQAGMQTTQGLLDEVASSAINLKTALDSTAALIGKLSSLTNITRWIPALGLGVMALVMLYLIKPTYAGFAAAVLSKYTSQGFNTPTDRMHSIVHMHLLLGSH